MNNNSIANMTKHTMANGTQSVTYSYDQLNRPIKYTDALGKSETYISNCIRKKCKQVGINQKSIHACRRTVNSTFKNIGANTSVAVSLLDILISQ